MKSVNFITPVPPQKQRELAWWFYGSCIVLVVLSGGLTILHRKGTQHCQTLSRHVQQLHEITQQTATLRSKRDQLVKIKQALDEQLHTIVQQRQVSQAPHQILTHLARIIPASCRLTKLEADSQGRLQLHGESTNAKACATFLDLLSSCPQIHDARLTSLTPASFVIVSTWKQSQQSNEQWVELHG